jgi:hypothetical protein
MKIINYVFKAKIFFDRYKKIILRPDNKLKKLDKELIDILLISADANKMLKKDNSYIDKYLDAIWILCNENNINAIHLSRPPAQIYGSKTYSNSFSINKKYFLAYILDIIKGVNLEKDKLRLKSHRVKLFKKILIDVNPRAILTINYLAELCLAARDLKIPLVEVLHGKGYTIDPKNWLCRGFDKTIFPTHVISYDEVSSSLIREKLPEVEILQVEDLSFRLYESTLFKTPNNFEPIHYVKKILVTLEWGYAGEKVSLNGYLKDGLLPNGLFDAIKLAGSEIFWTIRLHPVQMAAKKEIYIEQKKYLKNLFLSFKNVKLETSPKSFIYQSLSEADIHLTVSSMSAYEAAQMGKVTLLTGSLGNPEFKDLIASKWAYRINDDSETILKWITEPPKPPMQKFFLSRDSMTAEELIDKLLQLKMSPNK